MKRRGSIFWSIVLFSGVVSPAMALDYEAKPVKWVIEAPIRTVGALTGGAIGSVSGQVDGSYHGSVKATQHVAGKLGDEKGTGELLAAAPVGVPSGYVLGTVKGIHHGFWHGMKLGWEKPFSRWSYITMEEK